MTEKKKSIFVRIKDWFVSLFKGFWRLSLDVKIGIVLLIPPLIGVIQYVIDVSIVTNGEYGWGLKTVLYYGIMAFVGAYLIKGNLGKKE